MHYASRSFRKNSKHPDRLYKAEDNKKLGKETEKKKTKKKYHWQIPSIILLVFLIHRVFVIGPCKKILARKLRGEGILKTIHLGLFNKFY